jgi:hypothetical protein
LALIVTGADDPLLSGKGGAGYRGRPPMLLFVLIGHVPIVLLLAQLGMLYLAILDVREEADLDFQVKVWWVLVVLLFNVLGFLAEKAWVTLRRRRAS